MHSRFRSKSISAYMLSTFGLCIKRDKQDCPESMNSPVFPYGGLGVHERSMTFCGSESPNSREESPRDDFQESLLFDRWRDGMLSQYFRTDRAIPRIGQSTQHHAGCYDASLGKEYILDNAAKDGCLISCDLHIEGVEEGAHLNEALRNAFKCLVPEAILFCDGTPWGDFEIRVVVRSAGDLDDAVEILEEEAMNGCAVKLIPAMVEFLPEFDGHLRLRLGAPKVMCRTLVMVGESSESQNTLTTVFDASDDGTPCARETCVTVVGSYAKSSPRDTRTPTPRFATEIHT